MDSNKKKRQEKRRIKFHASCCVLLGANEWGSETLFAASTNFFKCTSREAETIRDNKRQQVILIHDIYMLYNIVSHHSAASRDFSLACAVKYLSKKNITSHCNSHENCVSCGGSWLRWLSQLLYKNVLQLKYFVHIRLECCWWDWEYTYI